MTNGIVERLVKSTFGVLVPHPNPTYHNAPTIMWVGEMVRTV